MVPHNPWGLGLGFRVKIPSIPAVVAGEQFQVLRHGTPQLLSPDTYSWSCGSKGLRLHMPETGQNSSNKASKRVKS